MDNAFTDMLFGPAPAPVAPTAPVIPPRPKDSGFATFLGLGPARDAAYMRGIEAGGQHRYRSAQTEEALAKAEQNREEAMRMSQANALRAKIAANPDYVLTPSEMALIATGANDFANSQLGLQERDLRGGIADLLTPQDQRLAYADALQGRILPRVDALGPGRELNLATQQPYTNPIGEAQIANYREKPAGGGGFTIGGVRYDAAGNPVVDVDTAAANAAKVAEATARARTGAKNSTATLPAKVRQAVAENDGLLASIDRAIAIVEQNPESFGLKYGLGDMVNQRVDPEGVPARAAVADIGSAKMHDRSGAAITAREFPRLTPFIPSITDRSDAILAKLTSMRDMIKAEQDAILAQNQPAAAPGAPGAPAAGGQPVAGTPPLVNAKGWKLKKRTNNGVVEYAYLGPNGEVEMVR